jgi:hypothetical protein
MGMGRSPACYFPEPATTATWLTNEKLEKNNGNKEKKLKSPSPPLPPPTLI